MPLEPVAASVAADTAAVSAGCTVPKEGRVLDWAQPLGICHVAVKLARLKPVRQPSLPEKYSVVPDVSTMGGVENLKPDTGR